MAPVIPSTSLVVKDPRFESARRLVSMCAGRVVAGGLKRPPYTRTGAMIGDASPEALTFVFTDLESSTRLWESFPDAMQTAMERHDAILRDAVVRANGRVVKITGDGLMAVFPSASDGVGACLDA